MRGLVDILVALVALWLVPYASCYCERSPAANDVHSYDNDQDRSDLHYRDVFQMASSRRGLHYIDMLVTSFVVLAIVFLVLRCTAYINDTSDSIKWPGRRLAAKYPCGEDVSC